MKRLITILATVIVTLSFGQENCDVTQANIWQSDFYVCGQDAYLSADRIKENETGVWSVEGSRSSYVYSGVVGGITEHEVLEVVYTVSDETSCPSTEDRVRITNVGRNYASIRELDTVIVCKSEVSIKIEADEVDRSFYYPRIGEWTGDLEVQNSHSNIIDIDLSLVNPGDYKMLWTVTNDLCSPDQDEVVIRVLPITEGRSDCEKVIANTFNPQSTKKLSFYPNPAIGNEIILEGGNLASVRVSNQLGQTILSQTIDQNKVDISSLDKGVYILSVVTNDGDVYTETLIKE